MKPHPREHSDYERLREQFESSRELAARARDRAARAAERAVAMRTVLQAGARNGRAPERRDAAIWAAAARAVEDAARDRDRVIGVLSHELRQSLAAALTAERLLVERTGHAGAAKAALILDRQLLHLAKLVDMLLDYSRLSVGTAALDEQTIDLRSLVQECVEAIEPRVAEKSQHLVLEAANEPQVIRADPTRVRQLLGNLLANAIRYTPDDGDIRVTIAPAGERVHVVVSDSGPGIAPGDVERIFEPFARASSEGPGLGVGLALARRIARVHGGDLTVHSDGPGTGSTFTIVLPLVARHT